MDLNTDQIKKMKQAICYDRTKVRKGVFYAWHNCYDAGKQTDPDWEDLFRKKVAFGWMKGMPRNYGYLYSLTEDGIRILGEILDITIIEK